MYAKGELVRFTAEAIDRMEPVASRRFSGRTGVVSGYRLGATDPIVDFEKDGRRPSVRLISVRTRDLELAALQENRDV